MCLCLLSFIFELLDLLESVQSAENVQRQINTVTPALQEQATPALFIFR